jgi:hypothetical protein
VNAYRTNEIVHAWAVCGDEHARTCDGGGVPTLIDWARVTCAECIAIKQSGESSHRGVREFFFNHDPDHGVAKDVAS